jgi:hypothetical protein
MSESNVVAFGNATDSVRKRSWLDQLAKRYDDYVQEHGSEPDAFVFVLVGPGQIASGWDIHEPFVQTRWNSMILLLASEHLNREASAGNG